MNTEKIEEALRAASDTDEFLIHSGCAAETPAVFRRLFGSAATIIVADEITYEAAGKMVQKHLNSSHITSIEPFIFPGDPRLHADYRHVERLRSFLKDREVIPIAVGSGTINDIVKLASHESSRRYMVVGTAASVDGYSSFGAAIVRNGFKQTIQCPAPLGIVADTDVLRKAPADMTAAGYADLVSKITAGADWLIADCLGLDPIHPLAWSMVQDELRKWIANPKDLMMGDTQAFEYLFEGLVLSGFAMQALRRTRSASGCEHLYSHIWEMQDLQLGGVPVSHGFKVSLGTLCGTALMEALFAREVADLDPDAAFKNQSSWDERDREVRTIFAGMSGADQVLATCRAKHLERDEHRRRVQLIKARWDTMRERVREQIIPYAELEEMLAHADCPVKPEQINLTSHGLWETSFAAQMIRERYTVLDLAYDLGLLRDLVDEVSSK